MSNIATIIRRDELINRIKKDMIKKAVKLGKDSFIWKCEPNEKDLINLIILWFRDDGFNVYPSVDDNMKIIFDLDHASTITIKKEYFNGCML